MARTTILTPFATCATSPGASSSSSVQLAVAPTSGLATSATIPTTRPLPRPPISQSSTGSTDSSWSSSSAESANSVSSGDLSCSYLEHGSLRRRPRVSKNKRYSRSMGEAIFSSRPLPVVPPTTLVSQELPAQRVGSSRGRTLPPVPGSETGSEALPQAFINHLETMNEVDWAAVTLALRFDA